MAIGLPLDVFFLAAAFDRPAGGADEPTDSEAKDRSKDVGVTWFLNCARMLKPFGLMVRVCFMASWYAGSSAVKLKF
jgi:hypothetical protein